MLWSSWKTQGKFKLQVGRHPGRNPYPGTTKVEMMHSSGNYCQNIVILQNKSGAPTEHMFSLDANIQVVTTLICPST